MLPPAPRVDVAILGHGDDVVGLDRAQLDVADRSGVLGAVTTLRPDVVVNAAAWTARGLGTAIVVYQSA